MFRSVVSLVFGFAAFFAFAPVETVGQLLGPQQPNDFFWSTKAPGEGVVNSVDPESFEFSIGETVTVYLYWTTNGPAMSEVDTGAFVDVELSNPDVAAIVGGESLDFDITLNGSLVGRRWITSSGPGTISKGGQAIQLSAFALFGGPGIVNANGPVGPALDAGYDADANAFLYGTVQIEGQNVGGTNLVTTVGGGGVVNNNAALAPTFGSFGFFSCLLTFERGDANFDGAINLLDVAPFVDFLLGDEFCCAADINVDGFIDMNDVAPFVDLLLENG